MEPTIDLAPCLFIAIGPDGIIRAVNETLCVQLRQVRAALVGAPVDSILSLPARIFYQTHFYPLLNLSDRAEEIFLILQAADKSAVPVLINAQRDAATGVISCAGITVHNRKKFEDELVAARKAAETALRENSELQKARAALQAHAEQLDEQVQRLDRQHAELRQYNHAITHDLQEPLRKMLVFGNMLLEMEKDQLPASTQVLIEKHFRVVNQMRDAVSGLQQFVWLDKRPGNWTAVDLNRVLQSARVRAEALVPGASIRLEADELPVLSGDEAQLLLLLTHLLQNALQFRKDGPTADVKVLATTLRQNRFRSLSGKYKYEDFLRLEIRDEGTGFDPAYNLEVFDLFKRLHHGAGRGVGLSLCRKIVENHGGHIAAEGRAGLGASIIVHIPASLVRVE
ncbi:MAG: putative regulatory protein [Flaviaesturariibacter sp.]|nr:putative regulatory protein [Flaviaesturariibacter sp.]